MPEAAGSRGWRGLSPNRLVRAVGLNGLRLMKARSGAASTVQTIVRSVVILGINFLTGVLTARFLGPSGRGEQMAIVVWPQLFAWTCLFGLPQALVYNIRRDPERGPGLIPTAIILGMVGGCIAGGIGAIIVPRWLHHYDRTVIVLAQWAIIVIAPLTVLLSIIMATIQAAGRFNLLNRIAVLPPLLTLALLGTLLATGHFSPRFTALAYLIPSIPVFGYALLWVMRIYPRGAGVRRSAARTLLSYGMRAWGGDLLVMLSGHVERALLVGLLSPATLGLYVVAQSLILPLLVVQGATSTVLLPNSAGRTLSQAKELAGFAIRINVLIIMVGVLVLGAAAPWLLTFFYGPSFAAAAGPFRILAVNTIFDAANVLAIQLLLAIGRPGLVATVQGIGLAVFVPTVLLLVPRFGLEGAALAWLASSVSRFAAIYLSFPLMLQTSPPWPIPRKADLTEVFARLRS